MTIDKDSALRILPTPPPQTLAVALTERCNNDCFFCTKATAPAPDLPFEVLESLAPFIRGARRVHLTGRGEPLLHPRIDDVLELIARHNDRGCVSIATNGFLLHEDRSRRLAGNLHHLVLSLNAATRETYERDMGHGDWERVLSNVGLARRHIPGEKMVFRFVAHRDNIREFPALVRLAHRFGVTRAALTLMIVTRPGNLGRSLWFEKALANDLVEEAREVGRELGVQVEAPAFAPLTAPRAPRLPCRSPYDEVLVGPEGKVRACRFSGSQQMGSVHDAGGLEAVWNGPRYQALRHERFFPECRTCFAHACTADLDTQVAPWLDDPATRYGDALRFTALLPLEEGDDHAAAAAALRSLAWQTYPVWECLVAFAGDPGKLPAPVHQLVEADRRARVVAAPGREAAMGEALAQARGDLVAALLPGSRWHPVKLERLVQELSRDPGPADGVVHGTMDGTSGIAPRQACLLRTTAARARPAEAVAALLGAPAAARAFAVAAIPDRLDLHVPGPFADRREAYLRAVARRLDLIGVAALSAGDGRAAMDAFQSALEADPFCGKTHHQLALAAQAAGRRAEARHFVRQALELEPENAAYRATARSLLGVSSAA